MNELKEEDTKGFRNFLRMDYDLYQEILRRIEGRITNPKASRYRKPLSPGIKLAMTLRYLASGDSYHSLMYGFRVAHNTISKVIRQVCAAIVAEFSEELIPCPTTPNEWKKIAEHFSNRWQLHNCLGALDGKHIAMKCPSGGGSMYYNYKGFHSIILMALVDGDYKFSWVEVGSNGSAGDAQVFNNSELKEAIEKGVIGIPPPEPLPHDDQPMPYFIAADDAFALRTWLMKPFSKRNMDNSERIFNYRLSRGRRIVENAFGILAHRFRCLLTTMQQDPNTVTSIVLSCICLHNLLRLRKRKEHTTVADQEDANHNIIPGEWRKDNPLLDGISDLGRNSTTNAAKKQREYFRAYYNSEVGSVPWQNDMI
eukprot:XP_011668548.1 PREDICTED: putative nuclease HARBI1 [Strongylocentrotus purpuratus]